MVNRKQTSELWIWRHLAVRVPADWEMLQYSLKQDSGRCAFADRHAFRLEMSWRKIDGYPDFDRMISDYLTKLQDEGMKNGRRIEAAGRAGLTGSMDGLTITRFGCYVPEETCLVELVFLWNPNRDKNMEREVLSSFHAVAPDAEGCRRWRAFGMDVKTPASLKLGRCRVEPAHVEWQYLDAKDRPVFQCSRRGLVSEWMNESVRSWLEHEVKTREQPPAHWHREPRSGHEVDRVEGRSIPQGWLRRSVPVMSEAWICPSDGRLYSWNAQGVAGLPPQPLTCCGGDI